MSTLAQLYTRIILDLRRTDMGSGGDLEQAKIDAVADAIENYADEQFWFNRSSGTVSTVANTATVALPSGMRLASVVTYLGTEVAKVPLEAIEAMVNASTPATGPPEKWAEDGSSIHLYPTPNAVYSLAIYGIADLGVPVTSNAWTVEGFRLILGEAKKILCRGPLRDADGLALAKDEIDEALSKLRRETRKRAVAALVTDLPVPTAFNIVNG
jgi:hypothetical protein